MFLDVSRLEKLPRELQESVPQCGFDGVLLFASEGILVLLVLYTSSMDWIGLASLQLFNIGKATCVTIFIFVSRVNISKLLHPPCWQIPPVQEQSYLRSCWVYIFHGKTLREYEDFE